MRTWKLTKRPLGKLTGSIVHSPQVAARAFSDSKSSVCTTIRLTISIGIIFLKNGSKYTTPAGDFKADGRT